MATDRMHPLTFRGALCADILRHVSHGKSCTVIGVGSTGKSNVARHLIRNEVLSHHLGDEAKGVHGVYVDFQNYAESSVIELHRMLIEGAMKSTERENAPSNIRALSSALRAIRTKANDTEKAALVRGHLDDAISTLFRGGARNVFFCLDDFDKPLEIAPPSSLNTLRALRDNYKGHLAYVVFSRREMGFVRSNTKEYEDFHEIAATPVFPVGPYEANDAKWMIDELSNHSDRKLTRQERTLIEQFSGGHAGILKVIYGAIEQNQIALGASDVVEQLKKRADVKLECQKVWDSLDKFEQDALQALVKNEKPPARPLERLRKKGLVRTFGSRDDIFTPLFANFISAKSNAASAPSATPPATTPENPASVQFLSGKLHINLDGILIAGMDEVEYQLFVKLYKQRNKPVPPRELIDVVMKYSSGIQRFPGKSHAEQMELYLRELMTRVNKRRKYIRHSPHDNAYRFDES
jgi:hypothetical protein